MDPSETQQNHRHFAAEAFNACWQLIDQPERSSQEDREMIRRAETSYWHWMRVEDHTAENKSIGLWLLARTYTLVGEADTASCYATQCLDVTRENQLDAFHEGYALEATARAYQALGIEEKCKSALKSAWELAAQVNDSSSRELLETDLRSITPIS